MRLGQRLTLSFQSQRLCFHSYMFGIIILDNDEETDSVWL